MSKITYSDKEFIYENASIPEINKITDENMNEIKTVVNENDTRLSTVEKYITATAGSNGDFYVDLDITLAIGTIVNISFPIATVDTANARLSIDGGTTYKNTFLNGSQAIGTYIQSKSLELRYDGTQWQIIDSIDIVINNSIVPTSSFIGNKRVYVKRINFGAMPNASSKSVTHGLNMASIRITNINCTTKNPTTNYQFQIPHCLYVSGSLESAGIVLSNTSIVMYTNINLTAYSDTYVDIYFIYN